jgi:hypothetical protein
MYAPRKLVIVTRKIKGRSWAQTNLGNAGLDGKPGLLLEDFSGPSQ